MKVFRTLVPLCLILFCTSLAFAGPQIAISDPDCTHASDEIQLSSNSFSFVLGTQTTLKFCNATEDTFRSLNFTITFSSNVDLAGIYCGAPQNLPAAAFDYCMVLDPNHPVEATEPKYGQPINSALVHEFSAVDGDQPTDFYNNPNRCFFGCTETSSGGVGTPITNVLGNMVQLSFNLRPQLTFASVNANDPNAPTGLLSGEQFTITFDCQVTSGGCVPWPTDTVFSFLASPNSNTTVFPTTAVPEPATIVLLAGAGLPALLRRLRKS